MSVNCSISHQNDTISNPTHHSFDDWVPSSPSFLNSEIDSHPLTSFQLVEDKDQINQHGDWRVLSSLISPSFNTDCHTLISLQHIKDEDQINQHGDWRVPSSPISPEFRHRLPPSHLSSTCRRWRPNQPTWKSRVPSSSSSVIDSYPLISMDPKFSNIVICRLDNGHVAISLKFDNANLTEGPTYPMFVIGGDHEVIFFFTRTNLFNAKFIRN